MEKEIKSGYNYYILKSLEHTNERMGSDSAVRQMAEHNYIIREREMNSTYMNACCVASGWNFAVDLKDVEKLPPMSDREAKILANNVVIAAQKKIKEREEARLRVIAADFEKTADTDILNGDFSKSRSEIDLYTSYLEKGTLLSLSRFVAYKQDVCVDSCHMTKQETGEDIIFYIPVQWMNYAGYSEDFLIKYMDFIRNMGFEFKINYLGVGKFSAFVPTQPNTSFNPRSSSESKYDNFISKNLFYKVHIVGSEYYMHNFIAFTLLRFLYNSGYNNLPGLSMQIKEVLGDKVSNFDALCLANYAQEYNDRYSIFQNRDINQKGYKKVYLKPAIGFDMNSFIERFTKSGHVDVSVPSISLTNEKLLLFSKLIKERKYEELYNIISSTESVVAEVRSRFPIRNKVNREGRGDGRGLIDAIRPMVPPRRVFAPNLADMLIPPVANVPPPEEEHHDEDDVELDLDDEFEIAVDEFENEDDDIVVEGDVEED